MKKNASKNSSSAKSNDNKSETEASDNNDVSLPTTNEDAVVTTNLTDQSSRNEMTELEKRSETTITDEGIDSLEIVNINDNIMNIFRTCSRMTRQVLDLKESENPLVVECSYFSSHQGITFRLHSLLVENA